MKSIGKVEAMIDAFKRKKNGQSFRRKKLFKMHKWSSPTHVVKVHVDAAIRCDKNMAGLGVVIRDSYSKIIATTIQQTQLGAYIKYAEIEAVNWVL